MRIRENINDNWLFVHSSYCDPAVMPDSGEFISLPHSWNAIDGHDDHNLADAVEDWSIGDKSSRPKDKYDRGTYWYYRTFNGIPQPLAGGRLYVEIPAAGLVATVYVNGQKAVYHEGGYSQFRADITDLCDPDGANLLAICVSNVYMTNVYPQFADFTFYGGLYRGVNLVSVARQHFDLDYYGAPGVMVTPVLKSSDYAEITIKSFVKGADENDTVFYQIEDQEGNEIGAATTDVEDTEVTIPVVSPRTWSPEDPNLYLVTASILHRNEVVDEVVVQCGIRSFSVSPDQGFILNGEPKPLRGVCRHQDRLYKGNALSFEDHYEDALIIKELGANAIRLAHYQHSQDFYDACDELGFVVWAEIPFITIMSEDPKA
ncbi:MAG: beta-galactosidase, partial [Clostridiales bacterium]|nr:beta-galactosidase [Clostridiales bacterium]